MGEKVSLAVHAARRSLRQNMHSERHSTAVAARNSVDNAFTSAWPLTPGARSPVKSGSRPPDGGRLL